MSTTHCHEKNPAGAAITFLSSVSRLLHAGLGRAIPMDRWKIGKAPLQQDAETKKASDDLASAGWTVEFMTPFTSLVGPLWGRSEPSGYVSGFFIEPRHLNKSGILDRGALLTFADHAIGIPGAHMFPNNAMVTLELNTMFLADAFAGEFVEGRSSVIYSDGAFIFVRGTICVGERLIASCEGVWKMVRPTG